MDQTCKGLPSSGLLARRSTGQRRINYSMLSLCCPAQDDDRRNDDDKKRDSGGAFMSVVRRIHILPFHDGTFLVDAHVESLFLKTAILCCESTIASMLVDGRRNKD